MIRIVRVIKDWAEEWILKTHIQEHNHALLNREEISLLPAYRYICPEDGDRIRLLKRAGLKISDILNVLRLEKGEALTFNSRDVRNFISKEFVGSGEQGSNRDVGELFKILKEKSERDDKFFYDFTVDEDGRLENIVWIPGRAKQMAGAFADVVVFDTTYRLNRYSMPFGCFAAVNNHGQTVILGGTLMRNETSESFRWIFRTWSRDIERVPDCIFTDQDRAMKDAISTELPSTKHGFCLWHITQKFPSWFSSKLGEDFQNFMKDFYSIVEVETAIEFEAVWLITMERHLLSENRHIKELFELREYWCPVYLRSYFFAGMASTQRSESLNALMDFFMTAQTQLHEFIDAFDQVVGSRIEAEKMATLRDKLGIFRSVISTKFEEQAYSALTDYAFSLFRQQLVLSLEYVVQGDKVSHHQHVEMKRTISWVPETQTIHCSCLSFQYTGILCRHALRALAHYNVTELPEKYLSSRWCRDAWFIAVEPVKKSTSPPISEDERWKQEFLSKLRSIAQRGASLPSLRAQLEANLDSMYEYTFGPTSEECKKSFPPIRGKRLLLSPSSLPVASDNLSTGDGVLIDKTNTEEIFSAGVKDPPVCVTKGRPRSCRFKSAIENVVPKGRVCRGCGKVANHNKRNCPSLLSEKN
ncbi:hypothetical protein R1sor_012881 [Riccia sorocarpa]|uniref:SWIM-type domain-containing protein n=1 Tax=Riccia sorocarpa TaxID=122646 RepID=A0ABD3I518_9MARC